MGYRLKGRIKSWVWDLDCIFQVHDWYHEHEHYINGITGDSNSPLTSLRNIYKNFKNIYKSQNFISIYKGFHCNAFQIVHVFVPLLIVHLHTPPLVCFFPLVLMWTTRKESSYIQLWDSGDTDSSLGWENPLGKEMAIHSRILTQRIPWTEEPAGLQPMGSQSWTQHMCWGT